MDTGGKKACSSVLNICGGGWSRARCQEPLGSRQAEESSEELHIEARVIRSGLGLSDGRR